MKRIFYTFIFAMNMFNPLLGDDITPFEIRHVASEMNLISINKAKKYLLLPIQENAPEAKLNILANNGNIYQTGLNVRLARENVEYYVPFDLSDYEGRDVTIEIQGMPQNSICWSNIKFSDTFDTTNIEKFRPSYHHTPAYGWMNDPNGMFYKDGVYHLYFQYNPYGSMWGNMHWGHSTSTDLVNWKNEGVAIAPDAIGTIAKALWWHSILQQNKLHGVTARHRVWLIVLTMVRHLLNMRIILF